MGSANAPAYLGKGHFRAMITAFTAQLDVMMARGRPDGGGEMSGGEPPGPAPSGMLSRCSRPGEFDHLARVRLDLGAVRGPGIHQLAALVEQVATPVGRLHRIRDSVRERHLRYLAREGGALSRPVAEGRAEAVYRGVTGVPAKCHCHRPAVDRSFARAR